MNNVVTIPYIGLGSFLHACWECREKFSAVTTQRRFCDHCRRRKNIENVRQWWAKQRQKTKEASA